MDAMKYLIVKIGDFECPIILDNLLDHQEVAMKLGLTVVSAGRVKTYAVGDKVVVSAFGDSKTLGLTSRHGDSAIIDRRLVDSM